MVRAVEVMTDGLAKLVNTANRQHLVDRHRSY